MISLLDLVQSPIKLNHNFYSSNILSPNINSYHDYFQKKIKQTKPQHKSSSKHKKSKYSIEHQSLISKDILSRAKSSQNKSGHQLKKKVKKSSKYYKIDQMYLSKVSQMASEISIPTHQPKVSRNDLDRLENRIMSEILSLREQKINALSGLNSVMDSKNKAVQILRKLQVMRQAQRMNAQDQGIQVQEGGRMQQENEYHINGTKSKTSYRDMQQLMKSPKSKKVISNSRLYSINESNKQQYSLRSPTSQRPAEIINSKLSQQVLEMGDTMDQVKRIKQQLMKPLLSQHPLLIKNSQLKHQLEQLKQQLAQILSTTNTNIQDQISHYNKQSQQLKKQLQRQRAKLSSLQRNRFQTFFPKDRQNMQKVRRLIQVERMLENKKEMLCQQLMSDSAVRRKREDEMMINELREENRQLLAGCEKLLSMNVSQGYNEDNESYRNQYGESYQSQYGESYQSQYEEMPLSQLQELVYKQQQNKQLLNKMLSQFRTKIQTIQNQNQSLKFKPNPNKYNPYYY